MTREALQITDQEQVLLSRIALKDQEAFEDLYDSYSPKLFQYARARLGDSHLAEEVVQETMWAIWQGSANYKRRSKPSTWIFGIAYNKVADTLKKHIKARSTDELIDNKTDLVQLDVESEYKYEIERALQQVSEPCRDALILSFFYQFNYKEIGSILGCKEGTVKNRIFRGKQQLRDLLQQSNL
jgi:RNA polymerase sigma-70 factor (ECF subfamily)